jgi:hypothetical protein
MTTGKRKVHRRDFLLTVGAAAGAVLLARLPGASRKQADGETNAPLPPAAGPDVQALFGSLRAGRRLGPYTLVAIHGVYLGALPVILRAPDGHAFQVDVLRRGDAPAVANTGTLSLYVHGGGNGQRRTNEVEGVGARILASALQRREAAGASAPALLTLDERASRHPDGIFDVPLRS